MKTPKVRKAEHMGGGGGGGRGGGGGGGGFNEAFARGTLPHKTRRVVYTTICQGEVNTTLPSITSIAGRVGQGTF